MVAAVNRQYPKIRVCMMLGEILSVFVDLISYLVKFATPILFIASAYYFLVARKFWSETSDSLEQEDKKLIQLTQSRRLNPYIFLSYGRKNKELSDKCDKILKKKGYIIKKYNPSDLWDDPAGEVIEAIEKSSVLLYVRGQGKKSDWIKGEIEFSKVYNLPFFEVQDEADLLNIIDDISKASADIDLLQRLGDVDINERYRNAYESFSPYIDNSDDHLYGSEWLSDLNMSTKQGGDVRTGFIGSFMGFIISGLLFLVGTISGLIWMLFL